MIIYTGSLIWVFLLYLYSNGSKLSLSEKQNVSRFQAFFAMAYLVFFIGLRSGGADTYAYIKGYDIIEPGFDKILPTLLNFKEDETLFEAYGILMKTLFGSHYEPYFLGVAAISGFAVSKCFYRNSEAFYTSMMLFILWGTWSWMYNGIKQFLAASILFLCINQIEQRKPVHYIICVLVASRIHTSALIMLPMYFLVQGEPWQMKSLLTLGIAMFAVLFTNFFIRTLDVVTDVANLDYYNSALTSRTFIDDDGSNPVHTLLYSIPVILAFIERETIRENAPTVIKICVNFSVICVCVSAIANVTSGVLIGRLPVYFEMCNWILLPYLFIHTDIHKRGWIAPIMLVFIAFFVYKNYVFARPYYYSRMLHLFVR